MRKLIHILIIVVLLGSCQKTIDKPNILFLMVDDLGKEWISCYGAQDIQTPFIDRLADQGIRFDNVYCMPQCTPTRVTLLTGQYPFRHGWINHWDVPRWGGGVHFDETLNPSLGILMKQAGYKTAIAGKWQIDDFRVEPDALKRNGFDEWCMWPGYEMGVDASVNRYWDVYTFENDGNHTYTDEFGPDIFRDFLIDFIIANQDTSWFIYYPMVLTHAPLVNPPGYQATGTVNQHKAMVSYTDKITGELTSVLESTGQRDRTIFIWTTDNGSGHGLTGHIADQSIRGGKAKTTENGICVPFIISAPGILKQSGTSDALIDFTDILPTLAAVAGVALPAEYPIDGQSFKNYLFGSEPDGPRSWILAMGGENNARLTDQGMENQYEYRDRVIRTKEYKLGIDHHGEPEGFYNLIADPYEQNNLLKSGLSEVQQSVLDQLLSVIRSMPQKDNDPSYHPNPKQDWDVAIKESAKIKK